MQHLGLGFWGCRILAYWQPFTAYAMPRPIRGAGKEWGPEQVVELASLTAASCRLTLHLAGRLAGLLALWSACHAGCLPVAIHRSACSAGSWARQAEPAACLPGSAAPCAQTAGACAADSCEHRACSRHGLAASSRSSPSLPKQSRLHWQQQATGFQGASGPLPPPPRSRAHHRRSSASSGWKAVAISLPLRTATATFSRPPWSQHCLDR